MAPSSPAWGLRPAIASRGCFEAEALNEITRHDAPGLTISSVVSVGTTDVNGRWIVTGTTASSGAHSIITARAGFLRRFGRKLGEIFGVARFGKSGTIEHVLGDRIGHQSCGVACNDVLNSHVDGGEGGRCAACIRCAGFAGDLHAAVDDGKRTGKYVGCFRGVAILIGRSTCSRWARRARYSGSPIR